MEQIRYRVKERVLSELDFSKVSSDEEIEGYIDRYILEESQNKNLSLANKLRLRTELFNSIRRYDVLTELLERKDITEIMINGHNSIFVECNGRLEKTDIAFESEERLFAIIQQIVAGCNRRINESSPICDARLADGSRVNIVINPISLNGHAVTIRKFPDKEITMEKLIEIGSVSETVSRLLQLFVEAKYNIIVSGGTGSGKTTFLNALSNYIPKDERIITIEDSAELRLIGLENLVRLETRNANVEGNNAVSIRDLIKSSLRMRPDRIIVGEVRDAAAIDMISAMNTGHDGSLSTLHSNSAGDALLRLETMYLMGLEIPVQAIRRQLSSAVDIIVHLGRLRDRSRKVLNISEVLGMNNGEIRLNSLFEFVEEDCEKNRVLGTLTKVNDLVSVNKLIGRGLLNKYEEICKGF